MAETIYYVDTDVVGGAGDGSSWANAYSSLNAAEQARDGDITAGNAVALNCRGAAADTAAVTVFGWTTDADSYVRIYTEQANCHSGVYTTAKYRLEVANAVALTLEEDHIRVEGLQIIKSSTSASGQHCVIADYQAASNDIRLHTCLIKQAGNGTYTETGVYLSDADLVVTISNCVVYGIGAAGGTAISANQVTTTNVYGCTIVSTGATNGFGLRRVAGTVTAKNCYARGEAGAAFLGTISLTTCASSDTTGSTGLQNIAINTTNFTNVTAGSEDFRLPLGSALIGVGTTLTDDPPGSTALALDIAGQTRTTTWDIGAWEYVSAANYLLLLLQNDTDQLTDGPW